MEEGTFLRPRPVSADGATAVSEGEIFKDENGNYFEATCSTTQGDLQNYVLLHISKAG